MKSLSWGVGQLRKNTLSFSTGFMMVVSGLWKVEKDVSNQYSFLLRGVSKFIANFPTNTFLMVLCGNNEDQNKSI